MPVVLPPVLFVELALRRCILLRVDGFLQLMEEVSFIVQNPLLGFSVLER